MLLLLFGLFLFLIEKVSSSIYLVLSIILTNINILLVNPTVIFDALFDDPQKYLHCVQANNLRPENQG